MAEFQGVNYAKTASVPSEKIPKGELSGSVMVAYDEYVALGTEIAADTIKLMVLPKGAKVIGVKIAHDGFDAVMDLGIASDANYLGQGSLGAVAGVSVLAGVGILASLSAETQIIATFGDAPSAGKIMKVAVEFSVY
jgi:hypothetical protein